MPISQSPFDTRWKALLTFASKLSLQRQPLPAAAATAKPLLPAPAASESAPLLLPPAIRARGLRLSPLAALGRFVLLLWDMVVRPERWSVIWHRTLEEAVDIGTGSVVVVGLVALSLGAVTCVQVAYNLANPFVPLSMVSYMVREVTILELAPTVTCIVLAGKVGSSIAGSLGTMRITEQISALDTMGINSASYLVLPRIAAALLTFPPLVVLAMSLSIVGGYVASQLLGIMTSSDFVTGLRYDFVPFTIVYAQIKAVVFALLISSISAYKGYTLRGGALEVGLASTAAVTNAIIAILVADFVLASILL